MAFRAWLKEQFAKNVPWDKLVYAPAHGHRAEQRGRGARQDRRASAGRAIADNDDVEGSVNYVLRFRDAPQDFAGSASKTFLGVQIQCAQCHDHKTEKWKQQDFDKFAACFTRTQLVPLERQGDEGHQARARCATWTGRRRASRRTGISAPILKATPTALDGTAMAGNVRAGRRRVDHQEPRGSPRRP